MGTPADELRRELAESGVRPGDEVIVPSYGTSEAAEAVLLVGARPVFVDIAADTLCVDPAAVAAAVTPRTVAVIPVHTFGHPADMAGINRIGARHDLRVIGYGPEDESAADVRRRQAHAAYLDERLRGVITQPVAHQVCHTYQQYVVRVPGNGRPDRDAFARALRSRGVGCHVPVQTPVHRTSRFRREMWLAETERAADECLALPVDAQMTRRELQRVVSACNALGGLLQVAA
ncbi:DegT/DnrJ/EryC1/StrS family aminotransferase [Streptomyces sp. LX-29]|uniref:DegT/DnrJ/EryC1/StrS family aminotransferase n=1 Tax=Streptomyces sp. LX-29 TaxID=2900152 RepID=UPI00240D8884|nr:DegT/DnrJ/EryC1/StrS family aminotransferase [Streptomyces sp. LX-29]WFB07086.1 DegT/DnrJ/EryC1/StrS family aminotransferase [Streptomyces sp. LX-29]